MYPGNSGDVGGSDEDVGAGGNVGPRRHSLSSRGSVSYQLTGSSLLRQWRIHDQVRTTGAM